MSTVDALVTQVAAHGLPAPTDTTAATPTPLADEQWDALVSTAVDQHVTGHLVAAISDGALRATGAQHRDALAAHHRALALDLVLERLLRTTSIRLRDAGIEHRALKGAAVAHTVYGDPTRRSYGDVDILVRSDQFDDALAVLRRYGGQARYAEPRPRFTERFGKGVCVLHDDLEVDVHRTFVAGPFGISLDTNELFRDPVTVTLAGTAVPALSTGSQFLHACYHASLGARTPGLVAMRDIAETLLVRGVDHGDAIDQARRWRARIVVQRAVLSTWAFLSLECDHPALEWALAYRASRWERDALAAYVVPGRSYALQSLAGLRALRSPRAKAAYASALLFPSRSYARDRGGYVARWRRTLSTARLMRALP